MTDMTESIELQAFKIQKDGYKVTVKFPCVFVLFYLETNSKSGKIYLASDYEMYHKSLQFVRKI